MLTMIDVLSDLISMVQASSPNTTYTMNSATSITFKIPRVRHPQEKVQRGRASSHLMFIEQSADGILITTTRRVLDGDDMRDEVTETRHEGRDGLLSSIDSFLRVLADADDEAEAARAEHRDEAKNRARAEKVAQNAAALRAPSVPARTTEPIPLEPGMYRVEGGVATKIITEPKVETPPVVGMMVSLTAKPSPDSDFAAGHVGYVVENHRSIAHGACWVRHANAGTNGFRSEPEAVPIELLLDVNNPAHTLTA